MGRAATGALDRAVARVAPQAGGDLTAVAGQVWRALTSISPSPVVTSQAQDARNRARTGPRAAPRWGMMGT